MECKCSAEMCDFVSGCLTRVSGMQFILQFLCRKWYKTTDYLNKSFKSRAYYIFLFSFKNIFKSMFERAIIFFFLKYNNLLSADSLSTTHKTHPRKKLQDQHLSKSIKIFTEGQSAKIRPTFTISMSSFLIILVLYSIPNFQLCTIFSSRHNISHLKINENKISLYKVWTFV